MIGTRLAAKIETAANAVTADTYKELNADEFKYAMASSWGKPVLSSTKYAWSVFPATKAGIRNANDAVLLARQYARLTLVGAEPTDLGDAMQHMKAVDAASDAIELTAIAILKKAGF